MLSSPALLFTLADGSSCRNLVAFLPAESGIFQCPKGLPQLPNPPYICLLSKQSSPAEDISICFSHESSAASELDAARRENMLRSRRGHGHSRNCQAERTRDAGGMHRRRSVGGGAKRAPWRRPRPRMRILCVQFMEEGWRGIRPTDGRQRGRG